MTSAHRPRSTAGGVAFTASARAKEYGCERFGAHPPFPFALGQLQALSSGAAAAVVADAGQQHAIRTLKRSPKSFALCRHFSRGACRAAAGAST